MLRPAPISASMFPLPTVLTESSSIVTTSFFFEETVVGADLENAPASGVTGTVTGEALGLDEVFLTLEAEELDLSALFFDLHFKDTIEQKS